MNLRGSIMARKKPTGKAEFVLFNVHYEDGVQTSNRRVPADLVGGLDGEQPVIDFFEAQDRDIAERSGKPRGPIKKLERAA